MTITGQIAGRAPLSVPDDPVAIAMFTAHRIDSMAGELSHARERLAAAKKSSGTVRAYHCKHLCFHVDDALASAHQLADSVRQHYPAEARELKLLEDTIGMAVSAYPAAKRATFTHLLQTVMYQLGHTVMHAQAMLKPPSEEGWDFDADHCGNHVDGALEHVRKLAEHVRDNYPAEARFLAELEKTAELRGGTIGAQLELAAWEHERRGVHGEWAKGLRFEVEQNGVTQKEWKPGKGYFDVPTAHRITAYRGKVKVGHLDWGVRDGDMTVVTWPEYQHHGVATHLFDRASEYAAEHGLTMPSVNESVAISSAGAGFMQAMGGRPEPLPGQVPMIPRRGRNATRALTADEFDALELSGWHDAWMHEARNERGEWAREPGSPGGRYLVPPHARLLNERGGYKDPADHPWFKAHPVSAANVVRAYDAATPQEKAQGMRWYEDAHDLSAKMADGDARKGAILLASYSPRASWPVNMFNAARAARENRALGPADGLITGSMQANAQKALDGKSVDDALKAPKTRAFARLIERGDDDPADPYGEVVVDRHAMSIAMGHRLTKADGADPLGQDRPYEHVADTYRQAAAQVSAREGQLVAPHQMQAITWLHQQAANQAEDDAHAASASANTQRLAKGRRVMTQNAWQRWLSYAQAAGLPLVAGTTALSANLIGEQADLAATAYLHEPRDRHGRWTRGIGVQALSPAYNEIPETRGTARTRGTFTGPTGRDLADQAKLGGGVRKIAEPITAAEARGNSRPVSNAEFQELARKGVNQLGMLRARRSPVTGLDRNWAGIKAHAWEQVQQSWGGATYDAHTGKPLATDADKYALSVKRQGEETVSVPEHASQAEFSAAMDQALARFRSGLEGAQMHLGVFHDDDEGRIDIDPVLVVDSPDDVESIGAWAHSVGGAYHFASGNGYFPPHVQEGSQLASEQVTWEGPGQWRSNADRVQAPLTPEQDAEINQAADES